MESFEEELDESIKKAIHLMNEAQGAVDEVSRIIKTKYPEVMATEVGGESIIFVDDPNNSMCEYYNLQMIVDKFGKR